MLPPHRFSDFIRRRKDAILHEWEHAVRKEPKAAPIDRPALLDHIPALLDWVGATSDDAIPGRDPDFGAQTAERHALERLDEGFDLAQVVRELATLRDVVAGLWVAEIGGDEGVSSGLRALNLAVDGVIATSIERYTQARDRTLQSLDRMSAAALEARTLDEFLQQLLRVLRDTTAAVDTATILLREGDVLTVRAAVGFEPEDTSGFSLRVGEGFAGTIASTRRPITLSSAATDPLVVSPFLRARSVKGLYGVPLIHRTEVIGVAHMGSLTASDFSNQDKRLLLALATRVTAGIIQHLLRETAERRARQQEALAAFGRRVLDVPDLRVLFADAAQTAAHTLAVEFAFILEFGAEGRFAIRGMHRSDDDSAGGAVRAEGEIPADDAAQAAYTVRTGQPVIVEDMEHDERFPPATRFEGRPVRSALSVPIRVPQPDTTFGVLGAHALRLRAFSADDVHFLEGIATLLGGALALRRLELDRASLLDQVQNDRARAQRALAEIDALLSSSLVGIGFLDNHLRYVRINDALAAINGPSAADHIGRTVREVLGDRAEAIEPVLRQIIDTGERVADIELTAAPPGRPERVRSFLANYFPVHTATGERLGIGAIVVEITDRARAREALRASEERLRKALSIDTVGVLFFRLDGRILHANAALERLSGYRCEELQNLEWQVLTPPEFAQVTTETAERLATVGETPPYEKQWIRPDGSRWWGLFAPTRLSGAGRDSECVEFVIDISERKGAEAALHAAMKAREEILAVVSHDLRNPLGAIQMAAALLARRPSPDSRMRKHVETIQRAAGRMDHLLGDLLDMASIQAGRLAVELKPENPDSLVDEAVEMHGPAAREKGLSIRRDASFGGRQLRCDRGRVLQVFSNLLGNAIKFCRAGDVITIRGAITEDEAQLAVSDTGPGIPGIELRHVFEPYWSAKRHVKKGTGLGLYISKGIVEAHGGRLWVESTAGEGATFAFTLPLTE